MASAEIVASMRDGVSSTLATMTRANSNFNSSMTDTSRLASQYGSRLASLRSEQARLQTELEASKNALNAARTAFRETGEAADQEGLQTAYENYNNIRNSLQDVTQAAGETRRALRDVTSESSVSMDGSSVTATGSTSSMVSQLATAGAFAMVGEVAAEAASQYATSALGSSGGNYVSSAISYAGMGAAIGTAIAPGIGTAVGAALGAGVGIITAKMDEIAEKDDYYKQAVQDTYDALVENQAAILSSGSTLAGSRETTKTSYISLLGGSESDADQLMAGLLEFSNSTPYLFDDLSSVAKMMLVYGYDQSVVLGEMTKIGDAAAQVGAGVTGMETLAEVIGEANMGELSNAGLERLIGIGINPYELLAQAHNTTNDTELSAEEIKTMVTDGLIPAQEAAQALLDMMGQNAEGAMEAQSLTYEGLESTLQGMNDNMAAAMGEGYNTVRMEGMEEQIEWLQGKGGEQLSEAYTLMGQYQASLENSQEEFTRDAITSVMNGVLEGDWSGASDEMKAKMTELMADYDQAQLDNNGAEMGRILAAAEAMAISEYQSSEGYQLQVETQEKLVNDVQEALAGSYYDFGYGMAQEFTKGMEAGTTALQTLLNPSTLTTEDTVVDSSSGRYTGSSLSPSSTITSSNPRSSYYTGYATGLSYVPYNDFPSLLHEGERVLTASENRNYSSGQITGITISGNNFTVRSDADVEAIATELMRQINLAMPTVCS